MFSKWLARCAAVLALVGFMAVAGNAQAATVNGVVVGHRGHGVSGATVKVAKHKHRKHKHKKKKHKKHKGKKAAVHAGHHAAHTAVAHGTTSGSKGHFTIHTNGAATLVAHKRGVGSGRASAAGGGVTIMLHKHHHHHSGAATTHAKHKHKHKKKGKGGKKVAKTTA
jgi:hypothetical protein